MKTIEHCSDVKSLLSIDGIYDTLAYDGSPVLEQFVPEGEWFRLCENRETAGGINLLPLNNVMWSCHVFIFEKYRGGDSYLWGRLVADWMRENKGAQKFLAITPYEAARIYAERVGFRNVTSLTNSIKKNGKLLTQYMLEMD